MCPREITVRAGTRVGAPPARHHSLRECRASFSTSSTAIIAVLARDEPWCDALARRAARTAHSPPFFMSQLHAPRSATSEHKLPAGCEHVAHIRAPRAQCMRLCTVIIRVARHRPLLPLNLHRGVMLQGLRQKLLSCTTRAALAAPCLVARGKLPWMLSVCISHVP